MHKLENQSVKEIRRNLENKSEVKTESKTENKAEVKNMETGEKTTVSLDDFVSNFQDVLIDAETKKIAEM